MDVPRKYTGLRFLALLIKIVAWLALILSIVGAFWVWWQGSNVPGLHIAGRNWTGMFFLPFGIYTFIQLYIFGSILSLFTDVEYNTRANATANARLISLMEKMEQRMERTAMPAVTTPPPPPPPPVPEESSVEPAPATPTEELPPVPQETQPVEPVEESAPPPPPPPPAAEEVEAPEPEPAPAPEPEPEPEPVPEPETAPEPEPAPEEEKTDEE